MTHNKAVVVVILNITLAAAIFAQQPTPNSDARTRETGNKPGIATVAGDSMVKVAGAVSEMGIEPSEVERLQKLLDVDDEDLFAAEIPRHSVTVRSFYLDKYLVTNAQFKNFIDDNPSWRRDHIPRNLDNGNYLRHWPSVADIPRNQGNHPAVNVNWYSAVAYCKWVGKRLPTEVEWEYAAKGKLQALFPWGDEPPNKNLANYGGSGISTTSPVGSYPANGYGLFDMAGNVWEFMADEWQNYKSDSQTNSLPEDNSFLTGDAFLAVKTRRVIRGGSWGAAPINLWVEYRDSHPPEGSKDFVGFRCARTPDER
jgi:formylglycine-generating enzyme required for sulfatase activity